MITTRRVEQRARARALQALYAADMRGTDSIGRVTATMFDDLAVPKPEREFAESLIRTVIDRRAALDADLEAVTAHWRLDRLGAIERSLLRLGAAELVRAETPPRVVLQECIRLAELFAGLPSAKFVNGVLDALARRLGRL
jgi:N utilization substance protein B